MLKDDSFLLRTFFTKRTTKFVERLNVAGCIDGFLFFRKVNQLQQFSRLIGDAEFPSFTRNSMTAL
jgi:hypothetical protein